MQKVVKLYRRYDNDDGCNGEDYFLNDTTLVACADKVKDIFGVAPENIVVTCADNRKSNNSILLELRRINGVETDDFFYYYLRDLIAEFSGKMWVTVEDEDGNELVPSFKENDE